MDLHPDLWHPIDVVCERTQPGLWAEPFNAVTALAYVALAIILSWRWRNELSWASATAREVWFLLICLLFVGVGSVAAHTISIHATHLVSGTATLLFMALTLWIGSRRILNLNIQNATLCTLSVLGLTTVIGALVGADTAQQQLQYLPILVFILSLGWHTEGSHLKKAKQLFYFAGLTFTFGLTLHALDLPLCQVTQGIGTHWLWHLTNDAMLVCLLTAFKHHQMLNTNKQ